MEFPVYKTRDTSLSNKALYGSEPENFVSEYSNDEFEDLNVRHPDFKKDLKEIPSTKKTFSKSISEMLSSKRKSPSPSLMKSSKSEQNFAKQNNISEKEKGFSESTTVSKFL